MMKKILVILFLGIFVLQVVSAIDTEIKIKTPSFTEVHLTILDSSTTTFNAYAIYKKTSDAYGDVTFTHSGDESVFDLMVVLKKSDETIYSEKFENNYKAGESIDLEAIPNGYELLETPGASNTTNANLTNSTEELSGTNETNSTSSIETNETNSTSEGSSIESNKRSGILGFSIFGGKGSFSFKTLYYIIGVIVLLAIAFFVLQFVQTKRTPRIKITKLSEVKPSGVETKVISKETSVDNIIKDAEERIKRAQEEINGLKKEQRIKEIKERMLKDKEALKDLSRG